MQGVFSDKSDVFRSGVLLKEIASGRRNSSIYEHEYYDSLRICMSILANRFIDIELIELL
jgi:hypothetical protein